MLFPTQTVQNYLGIRGFAGSIANTAFCCLTVGVNV